MPTNEEINDKAHKIIQEHEDDCLYYVAEKIANSKNIRDTLLWNQIFRVVSNIQNPSTVPVHLN